ncbi:hypothetical protein DQ384_05410 [Sphaerisporangium album]|uniref:Uncharacterized protein n=1 Tax=Sphaerisporangium album TaxID=509200 RepID=A0A367FQL4_9ACTN|nr:hypothetical protein [Sphaerisporangium album]RCG31980.1 hypothetical protein DQ384_05410 [Sphaerisporangium album]
MALPPDLDLDGRDKPIQREQRLMAAMCRMLGEIGDQLTLILDRLPAAPQQPGADCRAVELREPVIPPAAPAPAPTAAAEPQPAARARPRKTPAKATRARAAVKKEEPDANG